MKLSNSLEEGNLPEQPLVHLGIGLKGKREKEMEIAEKLYELFI